MSQFEELMWLDRKPKIRSPKVSKKKKLTLKDLQSLVDELNELSGLTGDDRYILSEHEGVLVPELRLRQKSGERSFVRRGQTITRPLFWRRRSDGRGYSRQLLTSMIHAVQVASQNKEDN
tara:strand:- start:4707 stop:5066 length:360 start_codon:yes stop_codon:yes gene_type:complete